MTVVIVDKLQDQVQAMLAILTGKDAVFTAFDVTKMIRTENPAMDVPHKNGVKEMVLSEYRDTFCDTYETTLIELTNGQRAYCYHPETVSPLTHPMAVKPNNNTDSDLTVENRLNISKSLLSPLNLSAGKLVKVTVDNGVLALTPTTDPTGKVLVVNADGRLRLGEKMLREAFGQLETKYDVTLSSDTSTIKVSPKTA